MVGRLFAFTIIENCKNCLEKTEIKLSTEELGERQRLSGWNYLCYWSVSRPLDLKQLCPSPRYPSANGRGRCVW